MGNAPLESNMGSSLRCCKCNTVLPPCTSFDDYYKITIRERFVYAYNGGEYYRPVGYDNAYECKVCFSKPTKREEKKEVQREEKKEVQREEKKEVKRSPEEDRQKAEEEKSRDG